MEDKKVDEVVKKLFEENANQVINSGGENPMEGMKQLSAHLEEGMMELYNHIMLIGEGLDVARLQNFMLTKILLDKKIVTEEEIEKRFQVEVVDEMKAQQEKLKQKIEEQYKELNKEQKDK